MMDLSIVLLEIAQMRQQELLRQAEERRRWRELEELCPSLPEQIFNHLRSAVVRQSKIRSQPNLAPSSYGRR